MVLATATLKALRQHYPQSEITWAVGSWSKPAIEGHPLLDKLLDTGPEALPVRKPASFLRFVQMLRAGRYDMAVSLVRSPLMSLAVLLSGIPVRIGLDSDGRGFGYNLRAKVDPRQPRHEADIYLDTVRLLGADTEGCYVNVAVSDEAQKSLEQKLSQRQIQAPYVVINPNGGNNPGMLMDIKRWPASSFAALIKRIHEVQPIDIILIGGPKDGEIIDAVQSGLQQTVPALVGELSFAEIAVLAHQAQIYIGCDTGLTHLAAAAEANTLMILGPSDPARYAPYAPDAIAVWKPSGIRAEGVAQGAPKDWTWQQHGVDVETVFNAVKPFLTG